MIKVADISDERFRQHPIGALNLLAIAGARRLQRLLKRGDMVIVGIQAVELRR